MIYTYNDYYIEHFNAEVLNILDINKVIKDLINLSRPNHHIVLVCYEKPSDFCHRHLVAEWLTKNGYPCEEYKNTIKG